MIARGLPLVALLLAACGGGSSGPVAPVADAETTLKTFLKAADDSNFVGMAENWGNARGSASETGAPSDYRRRMVIVQAYLEGSTSRVVSSEAVPGSTNQRIINVEFTRNGCVNVVPFTMTRTGRGRWVVNQFDLEKVGTPGRTCTQGSGAPN